MDFWRNEWDRVADTTAATSLERIQYSSNTDDIRNVTIVVTNKIIGKYEARSYPQDDINNNGKTELYEVDVYEILLTGKDNEGNRLVKEWSAPRFMPYWNNPDSPDNRYKAMGWVNAGLSQEKTYIISRYISNYELQNRYLIKELLF